MDAGNIWQRKRGEPIRYDSGQLTVRTMMSSPRARVTAGAGSRSRSQALAGLGEPRSLDSASGARAWRFRRGTAVLVLPWHDPVLLQQARPSTYCLSGRVSISAWAKAMPTDSPVFACRWRATLRERSVIIGFCWRPRSRRRQPDADDLMSRRLRKASTISMAARIRSRWPSATGILLGIVAGGGCERWRQSGIRSIARAAG